MRMSCLSIELREIDPVRDISSSGLGSHAFDVFMAYGADSTFLNLDLSDFVPSRLSLAQGKLFTGALRRYNTSNPFEVE